MSALIDPKDLAHETEIVWLEDTAPLDYVRQTLDRVTGRRRQPAYHRHGRLVGYAVLGKEAKPSRASGTYLRRVFWLAPHDRAEDPDGLYATGAPSEAVDPRTILPGVKGYKTQRSEGPVSDAMRELGITLPKSPPDNESLVGPTIGSITGRKSAVSDTRDKRPAGRMRTHRRAVNRPGGPGRTEV